MLGSTPGITLTKTSKIVLDDIQIRLCSCHTEFNGADLHRQTNKSCTIQQMLCFFMQPNLPSQCPLLTSLGTAGAYM